MKPLNEYTLADPAIMRDPYPYYARMREEDPVHFDEKIRTWLVTRHADIVGVARNTEVYSDEMKVSEHVRSPYVKEVQEHMIKEGFMVLDPADSFKTDGELHLRRRKLVAHAFSPPVVATMEEHVKRICSDKLQGFVGREEVDLVREFAMPIPILTICNALGLPMDRVDEISRGADSMVANVGGNATREEAFRHAENVMQLHRFTREAIAERQEKPGTDLLSQLVQAHLDDAAATKLTDRELMSIATTSIAGGVDTTRNAMAFALFTLATRADLLQRLKTSPEQDKDIARFVEETLRFYTPVPQLPRIALQDTELCGKTIAKGSLVFLCWASGNRDPERFEDPDTFNIDRRNANQHLTFGSGAHFCIGAPLARLELKSALREFVNNVESVELTVPEDQIDMSDSMVILRGLKSLPVRIKYSAN